MLEEVEMNVIWTKAIDSELMNKLKGQFENFNYIQTIQRQMLTARKVEADIYLVTSSSAIDYAKKNFGDDYFQGKKLVCFGKKTAELLINNGGKVERVYADNGKEFYDVITTNDKFKNKKLAYIGAKKTAFPLTEELRKKGYDISSVEVYMTSSVAISDEDKELFSKDNTVVCVASPSSVQSIFSSGAKLNPKSKFISIGQTTASSVKDHGFDVIVSSQVTVESMIDSLLELR